MCEQFMAGGGDVCVSSLATVGERKGLQEEGSYRARGREEMFASETFSKSLFINSLGLGRKWVVSDSLRGGL